MSGGVALLVFAKERCNSLLTMTGQSMLSSLGDAPCVQKAAHSCTEVTQVPGDTSQHSATKSGG